MSKEKIIKIKPGLTKKQLKEVREAAKHPIVYDKDCPRLSQELIERYKRHDPDVFIR